MIIADTGFFFALANQNDDYHDLARQIRPTLNEPLVTTYPVMTETCYFLLDYLGNNAQCRFLEGLLIGAFQVFDLQPHHIERAIALMERYADLPMDFADASLVVLAEHLGHGRILTVDRRNFTTYRWNNTNPFEICC
jgi:hypothetical protein